MAILPFYTLKLDRTLVAGVSKYPESSRSRLLNNRGLGTVVHWHEPASVSDDQARERMPDLDVKVKPSIIYRFIRDRARAKPLWEGNS